MTTTVIRKTKRSIFFPYAFENEELTLDLTGATIDDRSVLDSADPAGRRIMLHGLGDWKKCELAFEVLIPQDLENRVLPEKERRSPPWRVVIVSVCSETRKRESFLLAPDKKDTGRWRGAISFSRKSYAKVVGLRAFLTRTGKVARPAAGFAEHSSVRLASSPEWEAHVDPPRLPPGQYLQCEWRDFKTSDHPLLKNNPTALFHIEFGEVPTLVLNEGIPDFKAVLMSTATRGVKAAVRNALFDSIAQNVWTCLFIEAARSVPDGERIPAQDWAKSVLYELSALMRPDESIEIAVDNVVRAVKTGTGLEVLLSQMTIAIQNKLNVVSSTSNLLSTAVEPQ